ncbi:LLM class flavin-dependent oxidoreductase [Kosakonia quasisacchari]|uniref:LLM class flavin-dependent oxidoreductase n=1 Tax=Kosakonia quasisacchari TaxID=2529380 RepID=A0A4R0HF79_9ENTR|nr:type I polyketide synthase [Kosakonia quasisacchari]TCC09271.1 LLM class flavin-dependent oxidoreductase [Kosakonia quasisacchari]
MLNMQDNETSVAIVGVSICLPNCSDIDEYWHNILQGGNLISSTTENKKIIDSNGAFDVESQGEIPGKDQFDHVFFGISPREAVNMDPQRRLLIQHVWAALEKAGYAAMDMGNTIGLFTSVSRNRYQDWVTAQSDSDEAILDLENQIGIAAEFTATQIAYLLNLHGPAINIQTACSSSLVAIHQACNALERGDCDIAVIAAASIKFLDSARYKYHPHGIFSPTGVCRPLDADADGTVPGDGVIAMILRKLTDAQAQRDNIIAVIKGSAINNDGAEKVGFTAPGINGQAAVIKSALRNSACQPESIGFVELHGTGTQVGDPIELKALEQGFGESNAYPYVGSAKGSIGHLDVASGLFGLLNAALAVRDGVIPPLANLRQRAQYSGKINTFRTTATAIPWPAAQYPRRAGVSSFGIGGTNAHVIIEAPPPGAQNIESRTLQNEYPWIIPISAKTDTAFEQQRDMLLKKIPADLSVAGLSDISYTLQQGRVHFPVRAAAVITNKSEAVSAIASLSPHRSNKTKVRKRIAFLFQGQGRLPRGFAAEIYAQEPEFAQALEQCLALISDQSKREKLRRLLTEPAMLEEDNDTAALKETEWQQPALVMYQYALAQYLKRLGIVPDVVIGHSVGEYSAAAMAGVFNASDLMTLILRRGELMQSMPQGAMLAARINSADITVPAGISIAAVNGDYQTIFSGSPEAVDTLFTDLTGQGVKTRKLDANRAFHSDDIELIATDFKKVLSSIAFSSPKIRMYSNLTGSVTEKDELCNPDYWFEHARQPVQFNTISQHLDSEDIDLFIELGVGGVLTHILAEEYPRLAERAIVVARESESCLVAFYQAIAAAWEMGTPINWKSLGCAQIGRKISLPTYPFADSRHWLSRVASTVGKSNSLPYVQLYEPVWRYNYEINQHTVNNLAENILIISESEAWRSTIDMLEFQLREHNAGTYSININDEVALESGLMRLRASGQLPGQVILLEKPYCHEAAGNKCHIDTTMPLLLHFTQLWQAITNGRSVNVVIVAYEKKEISNSNRENIPTLNSVITRVISQEQSGLTVGNVYINSLQPAEIICDLIFKKLQCPKDIPSAIQLIDGRTSQTYVERRWGELSLRKRPLFCHGGKYVIIDGLEGYGYIVSRHILEQYKPETLVIIETLQGTLTPDNAQKRQARITQLEKLSPGRIVVESSDRSENIAEYFDKIDVLVHAGRYYEEPSRLIDKINLRYWDQHHATKSGVLHKILSLTTAGNLGNLILFSSLSTVLGGVGTGAYAAANAMMDDAVTAAQTKVTGDIVSLAWDAWELTSIPHSPLADELKHYAIPEHEAIKILEYVSRYQCPQKIIIANQLEQRLKTWEESASGSTKISTSCHPDDLKSSLAKIWVEMLGVNAVADEDDFFESGGHSLLAVKLLGHVRKLTGKEIAIRLLFDNSTFSQFYLAVSQSAERVLQDNTHDQCAILATECKISVTPSLKASDDKVRHSRPALSLCFFSTELTPATNNYEQIIKSAKIADELGFEAIWLPERHFHKFGGAFPNPALLGAAIIAQTQRIHIRAGSVIAPIRPALAIAEEWSMLDNLSAGRVGLGLASGWNPDDFYAVPENYALRRSLLNTRLEEIRAHWRNGLLDPSAGSEKRILHPTPFSSELPVWLTAATNPETFQNAGQLGTNLLTHLIGHDLDELRGKIKLYRESYRKALNSSGKGKVTVLLHAYVDDQGSAADTAKDAFVDYLLHFMMLTSNLNQDAAKLTTADSLALAEHGYKRYLSGHSLIGTTEHCNNTLLALNDLDVDEVACLVDFGLPAQRVEESLYRLASLLHAAKV